MNNECKRRLSFAEKDFRDADTNRDGTVTLQELHQILHKQNLMSESDIPLYFADLDLNKDTRISWREFLIEYLEVEPDQLDRARSCEVPPAER